MHPVLFTTHPPDVFFCSNFVLKSLKPLFINNSFDFCSDLVTEMNNENGFHVQIPVYISHYAA